MAVKDENEEVDSDDRETSGEREWRQKREVRDEKKKMRTEKDEERERNTDPKKLQVNMEYVKQKARRQYLIAKNKQVAKRNNNKDKGTMKGAEDIRDCFLYDDI